MTNSYAPAPAYGQPQLQVTPYGPQTGHAPTPQPPPTSNPRRTTIAAAVIGAFVAMAAIGVCGVFVGVHLNSDPVANQPHALPSPAPPSAAEVHTSTVDLCTRFAAGYRAMPAPQNTGFDIIPTLNYISDALRDNPIADPHIRDVMETSLSLGRDQASNFMKGEASRGAIQPATGWTPEVSNTVDQKVWDLCRAYGA